MKQGSVSLAERLEKLIGNPSPKLNYQELGAFALVAIATELNSINTTLQGIRDDLGPDKPGDT